MCNYEQRLGSIEILSRTSEGQDPDSRRPFASSQPLHRFPEDQGDGG